MVSEETRYHVPATDCLGIMRTILVMNGKFPGPLIEVNEGDRVLVNVTNQLQNGTSMHWHGLYQNGTNWMDGTTGITQVSANCGILERGSNL